MAVKKPADPPPPGAPLYMLSFGDMMTNLLVFFILLCSYATTAEAGLVSDGVGSFRDSLNANGNPGALPGDRRPVDLGAKKVRYKPPAALNSKLLTDRDGQIDDLNRDALRQVVKEKLKKNEVARVPVELIFEPDVVELSQDHRAALDLIAPLLVGKRLRIRVEGYAYVEGQEGDDLREIASRRAFAVAAYLVEAHGIPRSSIDTVGYGSGGAGNDNRKNRVVQDVLGRRIAFITLVPERR